ncbi:MAG: class I adenylate-forming enzyme family protein [Porticoccaceae bacterium]|nr:class I adenylate-forming enzyme family protein [Porticoccaceae bacterium]
MTLATPSTVYSLFRATALWRPDNLAIQSGVSTWSYGELLDCVDRFASVLRKHGLKPGDRLAILSENRPEYTMLQLACARIGAIVACLNWRLANEELKHCIDIVEPSIFFVSARFTEKLDQTIVDQRVKISLDNSLSVANAAAADTQSPWSDPEQGLLLLNTSGTTGLPKAALISHRAEIARMTVLRMDLGVQPSDAFLAWAPMYHMGGSDHTLSSMMMGAPVIITDGLDLDAMVDAIGSHQLGWLILMPATIEPLLQRIKDSGTQIRGVRVVGSSADMLPAALIAEASALFNAPFANSFGATETGLPPATAHLIPIGEVPTSLDKQRSSMCEFRIVDSQGCDVESGAVGEIILRGPTLFSGYWNAPEVNAKDFRGGWFHMGDLFRQTDAGGLEFAGRSKYMIKSGGENIYPAEIERVLLADPRIDDVAVVRKPDEHWGEIPVAFVVRNNAQLLDSDIETLCRARLAGYKRPREIYFINMDELPRSDSGKIIRETLERRLTSISTDS